MASHGVPRGTTEARSEETKQKDLKEIKSYQGLVDIVNDEIAAQNYTPQLLRQTAELLKKNPEYYTIWNHRRRIYANEFSSLEAGVRDGSTSESDKDSQVLDIIKLDLQFLFPLLLKFPKCYWIWNHRLWLLQSATDLLPAPIARKLWEEELGLVAKMLDRDPRNFHGWGYRRKVIASLESPELDLSTERKGTSMANSELDYTTKMIGANLSNFSAWHNRTKLISRTLHEQNASDTERKDMLDEEIKLIHKALFDPYDASLWSYHQNLLCTFDPLTSASSMAPKLSSADRLKYLDKEKEFVLEFLEEQDDEDDYPKGKGEEESKWPYQQLIDIVLISSRVRATETPRTSPGSKGQGAETTDGNLDLSREEKQDVKRWLGKLYKLDPLRKGRWNDLEKRIGLV